MANYYKPVTDSFNAVRNSIVEIGAVLLQAQLEMTENQYDYFEKRVRNELKIEPADAIQLFKEDTAGIEEPTESAPLNHN